MEHRFEVETPFGPVHMWGRDTGRPVLFAIAGAFAAPTYLHLLQARFPDMDLLRAHLPGNHCPPLMATSIGVFGAAYAHAFRARAQGRPAVVVGTSVGALVALAMRLDEASALVLVEPPLRTGALWPFRAYPAKASPQAREFLWNVLGVSADGQEDRDYCGLLDGLTRPATVLLGDEPLLPERETAVMPSLVDDDCRARLAAHPLVELVVCPGVGHNVPRLAGAAMLDAIRRRVAGLTSEGVSPGPQTPRGPPPRSP